MTKRQKAMLWAVMLSETSHVFCCVLPTLFSVFGVLANLGIVTAMPLGLQSFHRALHEWELPIIALSGAILAFGWALDIHARKVDCHNTGCCHQPCAPRKKAAHKILIAATALFAINVLVFFVLHRGMAVAGH